LGLPSTPGAERLQQAFPQDVQRGIHDIGEVGGGHGAERIAYITGGNLSGFISKSWWFNMS